MSQAPARPQAPLSRSALRIVLFGMPDAGKSSLLGALAQASETQQHSLKATLVDPTHALDQLRHYLYDGQPTRTSEEVVPFPVVLEPFPPEPSAAKPAPVEAVLIDCDGKVANEFLSRQRSLNGSPGESPLRDAIVRADTLVLVVDASASPDIIKRDFAQFARFLRLLEQSRSQRTDVGGLPVYLVLTKCDLLARKGDTLVTWMERIEDHKRTVDRKFQEYLAQYATREAHPFGKINLHLWATAVKHPALENTPARPRDPYGVAELFRQCLQSAAGYRGQQVKAGRRLHWTVAALAGIVAFLLLLALFFVATRPAPEAGTLEAEIRKFRSAQGDTPAERLKEPFAEKIKQLRQFESDPAFAQVSPELQSYVTDYREELQAYRDYRKELEAVQEPRFVHNDKELNTLLETLAKLPLPAKYATAWRETKVGRQRELLQQDADILRREVNKAEKDLKRLVAQRKKIDEAPLSAAERRKEVKMLFNEADSLPYREENNNRFLPGSQTLTYENVLQFEQVAEPYRAWRDIRQEQKGA
jgi:GTPase SAR1 family protein